MKPMLHEVADTMKKTCRHLIICCISAAGSLLQYFSFAFKYYASCLAMQSLETPPVSHTRSAYARPIKPCKKRPRHLDSQCASDRL
eukprot:8706301-Pyramimonas_sp.AAC.1